MCGHSWGGVGWAAKGVSVLKTPRSIGFLSLVLVEHA